MTPKNSSLLPLTWGQAIVASVAIGNILFLAVILISPHNLFHPLMILSLYFVAYGVTRAVTDDFERCKNPTLMMRAVFGIVQILAGVTIVTCVIVRGASIGVFWVGASLILLYFGTRNWAGAVYLWEEVTFERQQEQRVRDRLDVFAAQDAREALERQERAEEVRSNEESLMADLTSFFTDADPSSK